ncbi:hypothetical protein OUZ56_011502 [Daphnia magna]|uniref:Uncharacterized protein n=1 Tax=Daphnia magna TaxID=35525 RepID=A0ABQ9Z0N8_9CRUS|nr:hypothetical protein OUZ56_011502 [Daphnia magna]
MAIFRLTKVSMTPSLISDLVPSFTPVRMSRELVAHSFIFIAHANLIASASWVWYKTHRFLDVRVSAKKNKRFTAETRCESHVSFLPHRRTITTSSNCTPGSNAAASTSANETSTWQHQHRKSSIFTSIIANNYYPWWQRSGTANRALTVQRYQ